MSIAIPIHPIALMRICTAILLIVCATQLLPYADAFYAPLDSLLPLDAALANELFPAILRSVYNNSYWYCSCLYGLYISSFALLIGYRYRWACALAFISLLLLQLRNPFILQGGDNLLRLLLIWLMLLPANTYLAIQKQSSLRVHQMVWVGYVFQIALIYATSAWLKGAEWSQSFSAVSYAFAHQGVAKPFATQLLQYPSLLSAATAMVYYAEWLLPLMLIIGIWNKTISYIGATGLVLFHVMNAVFLNIGLFPWVGLVSLIPLLPINRLNLKSPELMSASKFVLAIHVCVVLLILLSALYVVPYTNKNTATAHSIRNSGLHQRWDMFAPTVSKVFVRFVMLTDIPASSNHVSKQPHESLFEKDRFRKFGEYASDASHSYLAYALCNYLKQRDATIRNKTLYIIHAENKMGRVMHTTHEFIYLANCQN